MPASDEEKLREGLLNQLRYLMAEAEALEAVIGRVPDEVLMGRPPGAERSIKEMFGCMVALDEQVRRPRLARLIGEDEPTFTPAAEGALTAAVDWNAMEMAALLARVQSARGTLADAFEALPPDAWGRTARFPAEEGIERRDIYEMAHAICLHDAACLRRVTRRLSESQLGPPSLLTRRG